MFVLTCLPACVFLERIVILFLVDLESSVPVPDEVALVVDRLVRRVLLIIILMLVTISKHYNVLVLS